MLNSVIFLLLHSPQVLQWVWFVAFAGNEWNACWWIRFRVSLQLERVSSHRLQEANDALEQQQSLYLMLMISEFSKNCQQNMYWWRRKCGKAIMPSIPDPSVLKWNDVNQTLNKCFELHFRHLEWWSSKNLKHQLCFSIPSYLRLFWLFTKCPKIVRF